MNSAMQPMFLPDVEYHPQPGSQADTIRQLQAKGAEYPQILHLFAYQPAMTAHLTRFTREVMRDYAVDPAHARALWAKSERMVGEQFG